MRSHNEIPELLMVSPYCSICFANGCVQDSLMETVESNNSLENATLSRIYHVFGQPLSVCTYSVKDELPIKLAGLGARLQAVRQASKHNP